MPVAKYGATPRTSSASCSYSCTTCSPSVTIACCTSTTFCLPASHRLPWHDLPLKRRYTRNYVDLTLRRRGYTIAAWPTLGARRHAAQRDFTHYRFSHIAITGAGKSALGMVSMDGARISEVDYSKHHHVGRRRAHPREDRHPTKLRRRPRQAVAAHQSWPPRAATRTASVQPQNLDKWTSRMFGLIRLT
jgi:hypothetical protein